MNIEQAKEIVISVINDTLEGKLEITEETQLIGGELLLDSTKLVKANSCIGIKNWRNLPFYDT